MLETGFAWTKKLFGYTSANQWLDKIQRDLKSGSPDDFAFELPDGSKLSPFIHAENANGLISETLYNPGWQIAEKITVEDAQSGNGAIVQSLRGGTEVLLLEIEPEVDLETLLLNVHLDMITTILSSSSGNQEALSQAIRALSNSRPGASAHLKVRPYTTSDSTRTYTLPDKNVATGASAMFAAILDEIEALGKPEALEIRLGVSANAPFEIGRVRSVKLAWKNICRMLELAPIPLTVEAYTDHTGYTSDMHINMIISASMALAAVCGGADRLIVTPAGPEEASFERTIARNVQHMLRFESGLDLISDPVRGSFFFDNLTLHLADQIITELRKKAAV